MPVSLPGADGFGVELSVSSAARILVRKNPPVTQSQCLGANCPPCDPTTCTQIPLFLPQSHSFVPHPLCGANSLLSAPSDPHEGSIPTEIPPRKPSQIPSQRITLIVPTPHTPSADSFTKSPSENPPQIPSQAAPPHTETPPRRRTPPPSPHSVPDPALPPRSKMAPPPPSPQPVFPAKELSPVT